MALSPENRATLRAIKHPAHLNMNGLEYWAEGNGNVVNTLMDAARAQGRASLEERVRDLEVCLGWLDRLNRFDSRTHDHIRALLATPGEQSQ